MSLDQGRGRTLTHTAVVPTAASSTAALSTAYLDADASKKLRRSGSLMAGSPGETLSSRP
jgi:hypothetical protein